jgi:hypothetical protein
MMTAMISAALTTFVTAAKSIVSVRKAISSFSNLLDDGQIDQLKKAVRNIYFFQDGFISDIDRLLSGICLEIDKIEKLLDRRGLQQARESSNG